MIRKLILMGLGAAAYSVDITHEVADKLAWRGNEAVAAMRRRVREPKPGPAVAALPAESNLLDASREGITEAGAAQRVAIGGSEGNP